MVQLVCERATEDDLAQLAENMDLQEFYYQHGSSERLLELDDEFHRLMFQVAGRMQAYGMMKGITVHFDRVRNLAVNTVKEQSWLKAVSYTHLDVYKRQHVDMGHPRIWLNRERIEGFRKELERDRDYCGFDVFYRRSVLEYRDKEFVSEPLPYPGGKRVIPLWRQNYMDCQTGLCHIRALAVAGVVLGDEALISQAKEGLLAMAAWDTDGPTKRDYNDECAFRVAYALAFGYDWLYDALSEEQRAFVRERLFIRTKQVADHIIVRTRIHYSLYDSHAVRSLSSVIIPCCIVLLGEYEEARQWLDYAIDYLNAVSYTHLEGLAG